MPEKEIFLVDIDNTKYFGNLLGKIVLPGDVICLDGELGAGKTALTQGIARGIPIDEQLYVSSPSFALLHEYTGKIPLYHMDFYRLHSSDDVLAAGLEEYFFANGVAVIEWASRASDILPDSALHIYLRHGDDSSRIARCRYSSSQWEPRITSLVKKFPGSC